MRRAPLTEKEVRAIRYAYEELLDFRDVIGNDASLDDEELPNDLLDDVLTTLERALTRLENAKKR